MKKTRFIIGASMSVVNIIFGLSFMLHGMPSDVERIMGLLWLIFALI